MLTGAIAGAIGAAIAVLVAGWMSPQRKCSECGTLLPRVRNPSNRKQFWWGGWTCPSCGAELDRRGKARR
jgi:hypothetical protein